MRGLFLAAKLEILARNKKNTKTKDRIAKVQLLGRFHLASHVLFGRL